MSYYALTIACFHDSVLHAILVLFQATTLNVAFNSHSKSLLTIMVSNNVSNRLKLYFHSLAISWLLPRVTTPSTELTTGYCEMLLNRWMGVATLRSNHELPL